jgi:hypothetical protein
MRIGRLFRRSTHHRPSVCGGVYGSMFIYAWRTTEITRLRPSDSRAFHCSALLRIACSVDSSPSTIRPSGSTRTTVPSPGIPYRSQVLNVLSSTMGNGIFFPFQTWVSTDDNAFSNSDILSISPVKSMQTPMTSNLSFHRSPSSLGARERDMERNSCPKNLV